MQLAQLDDFKARKVELNARLSSLEEQVHKQRNSNQESLEQLKQKDLMAKDRFDCLNMWSCSEFLGHGNQLDNIALVLLV